MPAFITSQSTGQPIFAAPVVTPVGGAQSSLPSSAQWDWGYAPSNDPTSQSGPLDSVFASYDHSEAQLALTNFPASQQSSTPWDIECGECWDGGIEDSAN